MRLLNTTTLEFGEFLGKNIPEYAILSHVWSDSEVSYEDYLAGKRRDGYGYQKILKLCEIAKKGVEIPHWDPESKDSDDVHPSFEWAWIDTCCIDKRSSAELSEAINSMYKWYQNAKACFTFLPDVKSLDGDQPADSDDIVQLADYATFCKSQFTSSKWFTRGWTLQELLAPRVLLFFNSDFQLIGHANKGTPEERIARTRVERYEQLLEERTGLICKKTKCVLHNLVAEAAGISHRTICRGPQTGDCIARRMSWASRRETTREEDRAYCLLGLFDVNMPLLYGEGGTKAFIRLQIEILTKSSQDQSIFVFDGTPENKHGPYSFCRSMLAYSAEKFISCGHVYTHPDHDSHLKTSCSVTSRGIEFQTYVSRRSPTSAWNYHPLNVYQHAEDTTRKDWYELELSLYWQPDLDGAWRIYSFQPRLRYKDHSWASEAKRNRFFRLRYLPSGSLPLSFKLHRWWYLLHYRMVTVYSPLTDNWREYM